MIAYFHVRVNEFSQSLGLYYITFCSKSVKFSVRIEGKGIT